MQKKIFLQKNLQTGGRSHVKWLMWAAVALIVLVLVTPLLVRHKNPREMTKKPSTEKGKVVKEIPKAPVESTDSQPAASVTEIPAGVGSSDTSKTAAVPPAGTDVKPGNPPDGSSDLLTGDPRKTPQWMEMQRGPATAPAPAAPAVDPVASAPPQPSPKDIRPAAKPAEPAAKPKGVSPVGKPAPAGTAAAGGTKTASLQPGMTREQGRPASTAASGAGGQSVPPELMKRSPSGRQMFCVQVGSFKDRKNADDMKNALAKKGYEVSVTPSAHPKLGQLYVVTLKPVDNMGKASTQVEQIKHEERVKPIILKIPPGQPAQ